jgi:hypothetical protein
LFHLCAVLTARSFEARHPALNAWLYEEGAFLELAQNAGALIFLFKAAKSTVDRLIALYGDSDHGMSSDLKFT